MIVKDLIEILKTMPQDAPVLHLWDGEPRTEIQHVYVTRGGWVVTADCGEHAYSDDGRPASAPTFDPRDIRSLWYTPATPQKPATTPDLPPTPPHA